MTAGPLRPFPNLLRCLPPVHPAGALLPPPYAEELSSAPQQALSFRGGGGGGPHPAPRRGPAPPHGEGPAHNRTARKKETGPSRVGRSRRCPHTYVACTAWPAAAGPFPGAAAAMAVHTSESHQPNESPLPSTDRKKGKRTRTNCTAASDSATKKKNTQRSFPPKKRSCALTQTHSAPSYPPQKRACAPPPHPTPTPPTQLFCSTAAAAA